MARPSISVKLSAIHPRFDPGKETLLHAELLPRVVELAAAARMRGLGLTIDAEEQDRLDMTLGLFGAAFRDEKLEGWPGLGLAVQGYGKRALPVLRWLEALAEDAGRLIPVRLVKGAYWDSEIKWAQERGLADYPVFTRKAHTDVSYLAAMRFMLANGGAFFPQFATHNAHTIAAVYEAAGNAPFEFQRLHGMGEALYAEVVGEGKLLGEVAGRAASMRRSARTRTSWRTWCGGCSRTAPTPPSSTGWPTRRRRWTRWSADPLETVELERQRKVRRLPRPPDIYLPARRNSAGLALTRAVGACAARARDRGRAGAAGRGLPDRVRRGAERRRGRAGAEPARSSRAGRHGALGRGRRCRGGARSRAKGGGRLGPRWAGRRAPRSWTRPPTSTSATACG